MFQIEVRSRIVGSTADDTPSNITLDLLDETLTVSTSIQEITCASYPIAGAKRMNSYSCPLQGGTTAN